MRYESRLGKTAHGTREGNGEGCVTSKKKKFLYLQLSVVSD